MSPQPIEPDHVHDLAVLRLGIDIGGTFTDFLVLDEETAARREFKISSTPDDPVRAVIDGIRRIRTWTSAPISAVVHGTTVATNAVLEGTGARVGLITTEGFRDVLHLGRGETPGPLGGWITMRREDPLADLEDTREVRERVYAGGDIAIPVDTTQLEAQIRSLVANGVESLTVSFLHSYANPTNEQDAIEVSRRIAPDVPITAASDVAREFREYERTETAVVNAYIRPKVEGYLRRLSTNLAEEGIHAPVNLLRSDGGMMSFADAAQTPAYAILSGPAGGVAGAREVAAASGFERVLTLDMGGTSTDVALCDGETSLSRETRVGHIPVKVPSVDIATVGAGGGSIAYVPDLTNALRVGPRSAGAIPGPACYGRGGDSPTVSDANVVLGYLPPALLGGEIELDREAAEAAVSGIAERLDLSLEQAALGIVSLANESMLGALRVVSVERGVDPRDFALVAFGGAGPLHANALAELLGCWPAVIPKSPGVLSALGAALTPFRQEFVTSVMTRIDQLDMDSVGAKCELLHEQAVTWMARSSIDADHWELKWEIDARYFRQGLEIAMGVDRSWYEEAQLQKLVERYSNVHEQLYGFSLPAPVEIVSVRLTAIAGGHTSRHLDTTESHRTVRRPPRDESHRAFFGDQWLPTPIFHRDDLAPNAAIDGPAIVVEMDATTLVHPGHRARVDHADTMLITPTSSYQKERNGTA